MLAWRSRAGDHGLEQLLRDATLSSWLVRQSRARGDPEAPIVAADGRSLARAIRVVGRVEPIFVEETGGMRDAVLSCVKDGDVVVTMGAGSIGYLAPELALAGSRNNIRDIRS